MAKTRRTLFVTAVVLTVMACRFGQATPLPAPLPSPTSLPEAMPSSEPATETPAEASVVTYLEPNFNIYSLDGTLEETRPATGLSWPRPNTAQVVGDSIYYVAGGGADPGEVVSFVTATGTSSLEFTRSSSPGGLAFAVSDDGSRIAWTQTSWTSGPPLSQLWIAGIDGSDPKLVTQTDTTDDIPEYFVLEPVAWLADGDLVFAWQVTGIGGYILFFGWSSLYGYDASTGTITPLAPVTPEVGAPCWNDLTSDGGFAVGACGLASAVVERNTGSGVETVFPLLPDQGQAGAGSYAPSGSRLAYAIAKSNQDNEAGQVVLVPARGEAPAAIASQTGGAFARIEWIDEQRLIADYWLGSGLANSFVDLLSLDGSRTPIGQGSLVGLMRR